MRRFISKALTFVLGVVWLVSKTSFAQIPVALPTDFFTQRDIVLPVSIGDVTGQDVKAFFLTITFDATVLEIKGVETVGSLAENFSVVMNTDTPGQVTIGGAHFDPIRGSGELLRLNARFLKKGTSNLVFSSVMLNEGNPAVAAADGLVSNSIQVSNEDDTLLPAEFKLAGNYPNPFNPTTAIQFDLPEAADVRVDLIDMLGRVVMTIPEQPYQAGASHRIDVDASSLASGIYVYQVVAKGNNKTFIESSTMTLIK